MTKKDTKDKPKRKHPSMIGNQYGKGHGRPEEWTAELIEKIRLSLETWMQNPDNFYLEGFWPLHGMTREHARVFSEKSKSFSDTLSRAKELQEQRLITGASNRTLDGNFIKFVLANRHGWREKTEHQGSTTNPLSFVLSSLDTSARAITIEGEVATPLIEGGVERGGVGSVEGEGG